MSRFATWNKALNGVISYLEKELDISYEYAARKAKQQIYNFTNFRNFEGSYTERILYVEKNFNNFKTFINKKYPKSAYVFLATINGFDGKSIVGVFSKKEIALRKSTEYLLKNSISTDLVDVMQPYNERVIEESEGESFSYDISNSEEVLLIRKIKVDE